MDDLTIYETEIIVVKMDEESIFLIEQRKGEMIMEVTINGVKKEVSKEEMKDRVIGYYDAVGIKHFYLEVDEMDDEELKALYINSFASE